MKKRIFTKPLLISTSIIALTMLSYTNTARSHNMTISPTCHTTHSHGSPASQASAEDLCPGSVKPADLICTPTKINVSPIPDSFGGCCFVAGTKVLMSDGTHKNIEDIVLGDEVAGGDILLIR